MEEIPAEQLVEEFKAISAEYDRRRRKFDEECEELLRRRRDITQILIMNTGSYPSRTHKKVGEMLGLTAGRVGQLAKGSELYVPQRHPAGS